MNKRFLTLNSKNREVLVEKIIINREFIIFMKFVLIREMVWHTVCIILSVIKK